MRGKAPHPRPVSRNEVLESKVIKITKSRNRSPQPPRLKQDTKNCGHKDFEIFITFQVEMIFRETGRGHGMLRIPGSPPTNPLYFNGLL